ncbi:hypothetical protein EDC24_2206 [Aquisalibacillus elongatus]|uniref:Uncharacterized protein n=1 Tax=Aquisalibacillus elongatus TaxID=485577 RepID=A0A3N5C2H2_9BACI|nr:hypothetical protein EDC24_2206 [Aquisalibacillus elongatus]
MNLGEQVLSDLVGALKDLYPNIDKDEKIEWRVSNEFS